jgi:hypothetical protein
MILHRSRLRKNSSAWFDKVSTNGKYSIIANSTPFAPSVNSGRAPRLSKGERWVFQQPARYSFVRTVALNLIGFVSLVITLCVAFPFFLVVVSVGTASAGACALRHWRFERRGRHSGFWECERLSFLTLRAKRTRDLNNSIAEESSVQFEIDNQRAAIPTKDAKKNN